MWPYLRRLQNDRNSELLLFQVALQAPRYQSREESAVPNFDLLCQSELVIKPKHRKQLQTANARFVSSFRSLYPSAVCNLQSTHDSGDPFKVAVASKEQTRTAPNNLFPFSSLGPERSEMPRAIPSQLVGSSINTGGVQVTRWLGMKSEHLGNTKDHCTVLCKPAVRGKGSRGPIQSLNCQPQLSLYQGTLAGCMSTGAASRPSSILILSRTA